MTRSCWKVGLGVFNTGKNNFNLFFLMKKHFKKHENYNKSIYTFKYPKKSKKKKKNSKSKNFPKLDTDFREFKCEVPLYETVFIQWNSLALLTLILTILIIKIAIKQYIFSSPQGTNDFRYYTK
jgi:hypothetical protein